MAFPESEFCLFSSLVLISRLLQTKTITVSKVKKKAKNIGVA